MTSEEPQQFANLRWTKRWNNIPDDVGVAALTRSGHNLMLVGVMGVLHFDKEDIPAIIKHHQAALRLLEGITNVDPAEVQAEPAVGRNKDIHRH